MPALTGPTPRSSAARSGWRLATTALVVAMAAWEVFHQAWADAPLDRHPSPDLIDFYVNRLSGVRRSLGDRKVSGRIGYCYFLPSEKALLPDYFASEYALAPWVLDWHYTGYEWVVLNVRMRSHSALPRGFSVVEDFGDGVFLLRRDSR